MRESSFRLGLWIACAGALWCASGSTAAAQFIPRHCGMQAGTETYGQLTIGSTVVLGRHSPWAGDANWDETMQRWVGMPAVITQLAGVDTAGCPGIRVSADGGQYFWRIRDAQPAGYGGPPPPPPVYGGGGGGGEPIPRHCGMTAGRETFGIVRPGTQLVLGRHTPWAGDDNWSADMNRFIGMVGVVTSFDGVDTAGCPGVRVSVDGGQWFWRIRDAQLAGVAMAPPMPAAIPTWCGMVGGGETYGPVMVGSWVILGAHSPWNGDVNWSPEMSRWIGQRGQVTSLDGVDSAGCPGVRVTADGGQFFWRIRDMRM